MQSISEQSRCPLLNSKVLIHCSSWIDLPGVLFIDVNHLSDSSQGFLSKLPKYLLLIIEARDQKTSNITSLLLLLERWQNSGGIF